MKRIATILIGTAIALGSAGIAHAEPGAGDNVSTQKLDMYATQGGRMLSRLEVYTFRGLTDVFTPNTMDEDVQPRSGRRTAALRVDRRNVDVGNYGAGAGPLGTVNNNNAELRSEIYDEAARSQGRRIPR